MNVSQLGMKRFTPILTDFLHIPSLLLLSPHLSYQPILIPLDSLHSQTIPYAGGWEKLARPRSTRCFGWKGICVLLIGILL